MEGANKGGEDAHTSKDSDERSWRTFRCAVLKCRDKGKRSKRGTPREHEKVKPPPPDAEQVVEAVKLRAPREHCQHPSPEKSLLRVWGGVLLNCIPLYPACILMYPEKYIFFRILVYPGVFICILSMS